ncbi:hypothetical protein QJS10_CPA06g01089 [Acorus calamus]|uniref:Uncharacterized protein n=1 Tax=Acorus calamus TaxID=4465 RepID=A0AAV9ELZ9_ACOCL|nr:hypothetical protein QJS10_CPA06g01089 [Acorus calamus]
MKSVKAFMAKMNVPQTSGAVAGVVGSGGLQRQNVDGSGCHPNISSQASTATEMQIGKKCSLLIFDEEIIAHGERVSVDPTLIVHGLRIGNAFYKVVLIEIMVESADLFKNDGFHNTLGEVGVGGFVVRLFLLFHFNEGRRIRLAEASSSSSSIGFDRITTSDFIYDLNDDRRLDWAMIKSHLNQGNSRASKPLGIFTDPLPGHNQASTSGTHMVNMVKRGRQPSPQPSSSEDVTDDSLSEESEEEGQNEPFQLNLDNHDLAILYGEEENAVLALLAVINIE